LEECPVVDVGRFELQPERRRLMRDGEPVAVGARAFDLLQVLAERRDRVVSKAELLDLVWPGLVVEENNLQVQISTLRRLLGPQAIVTIPGRGYRFTAEIAVVEARGPNSAEPQPISSPGATEASAVRAGNLPAELPPLYGRDVDLAALRTLIEAHRVVTVVGSGGIGKTAVSQALAHGMRDVFDDGVWLVELAPVVDAALVAPTVAAALGIRLGTEAPVDAMVKALNTSRMLVVVDNCEQVLQSVAELAAALQRAAPNIRLLATSQEPLKIAGEQLFRLSALALPLDAELETARHAGAVALFAARARAVDPRFELSAQNVEAVVDICRQLDGIALAIELAAARLPLLGVDGLRARLGERFRVLTGGTRLGLPRHQTLSAALEWSHALLTPDEQTVFRRLGVFIGSFGLENAQRVAIDERIDEWAVLDQLGALVDKSLVVAEAGGEPRYRLLETSRAFALRKLEQSGEAANTRRLHALAVRGFFERVDRANLDGGLRTDELEALLLPELDNLRAAHAWAIGEGGDAEVAIVLAACATALEDFAVECAPWMLPLRRYVEGGTVPVDVVARYWRALASGNMAGHVPLNLQAEAASLAHSLYTKAGRPRQAYSSLMLLAACRLRQGRNAEARSAADAARALVQPDWPGMLMIRLLRFEGSFARRAGHLAQALELFRDAVRVSVSTGDWLLEVIARVILIDHLWRAEAIDEALGEARRLAEELRARPTTQMDMADAFSCLVGILAETGCIDEACGVALEALPIVRRSQAYCIEVWVYLLWRLGCNDVAALLLGASESKTARQEGLFQPNEQRLLREARASLEALVPPRELAITKAAGSALGEPEMLALVFAALTAHVGSIR
jgi:predicted ATPase/DNA-binding winged helix-turn-helix (wHTH) protein